MYVVRLPFPGWFLGEGGGSGGCRGVAFGGFGIAFGSGIGGLAFVACAFAVAPTSSLLPLLGFRSTSGLPIGSSLAGSYDFPPGPNTVHGWLGRLFIISFRLTFQSRMRTWLFLLRLTYLGFKF